MSMSMILFYTMFVVGLAMLVGGCYAILNTKRALVPALVALAGIILAFFLPEMLFGPSGIYLSPATKLWLSVHEIAGYVAFAALVIVIITDLVFCLMGEPLSQRNRIKDGADAETTPDWIKKQTKYEYIGLASALLLIIILFVTFLRYHDREHPLTEVGQVATERGFPVQVNPFIVEVPGEQFPSIDDLKRKAVLHASAHGVAGLKIDHVYSLRFIARDNNHIGEVVIVFDGTAIEAGAPGRVARAAIPAQDIRAFAEVPVGRTPLDRMGISVPQQRSDTVTEHYAIELVDQLNSRSPINGMGFSFLGNGRPTFSPSPIGGSLIFQSN